MAGSPIRLVLATALVLSAGCAAAPPRPMEALSAEEHNDLGVAYYRQGEYAAAARSFRRALDRRPGFTRALVNLGDAEQARGSIDAAIVAYEAARVQSPDDAGVANNLAWALLQHAERWPEAEPLVRAALARDPAPRGYYLDTLGSALLRKGEPREALDAFRAALADSGLRDPATRALVITHAGDALARLGQAAAAERCYRLAQSLEGRDGRPSVPDRAVVAVVVPGDVRPDPPPAIGKVGDSDPVC
jgi:tetratricopeptide (TPR) repeat protein